MGGGALLSWEEKVGAPCKLRPTPQLNTPAGRPSEGWEKVRVESLSPLCDPVDCSPPGSSVHGILQARTGVGHHFLLQGIFLTQGWNPGLLHGRQTLYRLSPQGREGWDPGTGHQESETGLNPRQPGMPAPATSVWFGAGVVA